MRREAQRRITTALMMAALMMAALIMTATLGACGDGLEPTGRITKARIVGVQSVVQEDPSRTNARPGETVEVTLLVTQPNEATLNTWAFIICEPAATTFGVPRCEEGEPLAFVSSMTPVTDAPFFSFRIPEGTSEDLLYVGGVCLGGALSPTLLSDPLADPCAESGVGRLVTGALRVQGEGAFENHAPRIDEVTLDGEAWTSVAPMPAAGCRDAGLPLVSFSNEDIVRIEVFPSEDSREASGADGEAEELPVAFFSTERGLTRFYSVIDDARAHATADFDTREITETDAQTIPVDGRVVRLEFVMRDDHGGVDRETRALCLIP